MDFLSKLNILCNLYQLQFSCFSCKCNSSGSLDTVCNATTGTCHCKQFVMGMNCDICKDSFQYLEASNPFGCSKGKDNDTKCIFHFK